MSQGAVRGDTCKSESFVPQGAFQITSREALGFIVFILIMPFPVAKLDGSDLPASITAYTKVRPENYSSISELLLFMFADSYIPWTASATYSGRNPAADRAAGGAGFVVYMSRHIKKFVTRRLTLYFYFESAHLHKTDFV